MMNKMMMQPMTPASENSGIASGMMAEVAPPDGVETMRSMASQMEQVYNKLDSSENIEDVINAMRGDEQPLSERYNELAELVGPADAKKTPESVLTVLQPTFQILQSVPDGGIASAPMGGVEGSEENFSGPSATAPTDQAEAVLAMSRGEMPVKAANGFYAGDIDFMGNRPTQFNRRFPPGNTLETVRKMGGMGATAQDKFPTIPDYSLPKVNPPEYRTLQPADLSRNLGMFQNINVPFLTGETSPQKVFDERQKLLAEFAPKTETAEDILARRREFMGTTDADDAETQAFLALAQAGSQLAQTPGSLLTGLTTAAGPLATNLSKIAATKSAREREAKGAAFDLSEQQEEKLRQFNQSIAVGAIDAAEGNEKDFRQAKNRIKSDLISAGILNAQKEIELANKAASVKYSQDLANQANFGRYSEIYAKVNPETNKVETIMFYPGAEPYYMDLDKGYVKGVPPKGFTKVKASEADDLLAQGKLSGLNLRMIKNGKRTFAMVRNPNYKTGDDSPPFIAREALMLGEKTYIPTGDNSFQVLTPGTFFTVKDPKTMTEVDDLGRTVFKDQQGRTIKVFNPVLGSVDIMGAATGKNGPAFSGQITAQNQEELSNRYGTDLSGSIGKNVVLGNPNFTRVVNPPLPYDVQMIPDGKGGFKEGGYILSNPQKSDFQETLKATGELMGQLRELGRSEFFETLGISGGIKQFLSENVAGLLGEKLGRVVRNPGGAEADQMRLQLSRAIKQALALSKRYPVTEMEQLNGLINEAGELTTDPINALKRFQTFYHAVQRDYLNSAHVLDRRNNPYVNVRQQPMGNKDDPLDATATIRTSEGQLLNPDLITAARIASSGRKLEGLFMKMTRGQAKALGLPQTVWKLKDGSLDSTIVVKLKTIKDQEGNSTIGADTTRRGTGQGGSFRR